MKVEDGKNTRNPADEDDDNSSSVPIIPVQWLFDDHVDALIKDKYLDVYSTIFQHL